MAQRGDEDPIPAPALRDSSPGPAKSDSLATANKPNEESSGPDARYNS